MIATEMNRDYAAEAIRGVEVEVVELQKKIDTSKVQIYSGLRTDEGHDYVAKHLREIGMTVLQITEAGEMLARVRRAPPDLVIIMVGYGEQNPRRRRYPGYIGLPDGYLPPDGLGFIDVLGADPKTRMLPVLVITRISMVVEFAAEDAERYLRWDNYPWKPIYLQHKVLQLLVYVNEQRQAQTTAAPGSHE